MRDRNRIGAGSAPAEVGPPVNFYSIEFATPARSFWESLARLLGALGEAARRKGARR